MDGTDPAAVGRFRRNHAGPSPSPATIAGDDETDGPSHAAAWRTNLFWYNA